MPGRSCRPCGAGRADPGVSVVRAVIRGMTAVFDFDAPGATAEERVWAAFDRSEEGHLYASSEVSREWRRIAETLALVDEHPHVMLHRPEGAVLSSADRRWAHDAAVADLAARLHLSEYTVRTSGAAAATLITRAPRVWRAFCWGEVGPGQAKVVAETFHAVPEGDDALDARLDAALLEPASTLPPGVLKSKARTIADRMHTVSLQQRARAAATLRNVWIDPAADGMAVLSALLPAEIATAAYERIDATARQLWTEEREGLLARRQQSSERDGDGHGVDAHDGDAHDGRGLRSLGQVRSDVFGDLLTAGSIDLGEGVAPLGGVHVELFVNVPESTLTGDSDEPGYLAGYGQITPESARLLAGAATSWRRLVENDQHHVIAVEQGSYKPPAWARRTLRLLEDTCRFPGCRRRAATCDLDHTEPYSTGGHTCVHNLAHLCRKHHRMKHRTGWRVEQHHGRHLRWVSPTGYGITTAPEIATAPPNPPPNPPPPVNAWTQPGHTDPDAPF